MTDTADIKNKRERGGCWRCGSQEVSLLDRVWKLLGNYHAKLCHECLNDYEIAVRKLPLYNELKAVEVKINCAYWKTIRDEKDRESEIMLFVKEQERVHSELFTWSETWADDVVERPAPPPPPPPTEEEIKAYRTRRVERLKQQLEMLELQEKVSEKGGKIEAQP